MMSRRKVKLFSLNMNRYLIGLPYPSWNKEKTIYNMKLWEQIKKILRKTKKNIFHRATTKRSGKMTKITNNPNKRKRKKQFFRVKLKKIKLAQLKLQNRKKNRIDCITLNILWMKQSKHLLLLFVQDSLEQLCGVSTDPFKANKGLIKGTISNSITRNKC